MRLRFAAVGVAAAMALLGWQSPARAVWTITNSSASNPTVTRNTTDPGDGSGWQYEGIWHGAYLGTPIAPQYFIAAKHVFGNVGDTFVLNGQSYTTTGYTDIANSDLRVWKVAETFTNWATLWDPAVDGSEVGQTMHVYGRGVATGTAATVGSAIHGWNWGTADQVKSWGEDTIDIHSNGYLTWYFQRSLGSTSLTGGDSSGGVFIESNGVWKLAGINAGTIFRFSYDGVGSANDGVDEFDAQMFDWRDLYYSNNLSTWTYAGTGPFPIPGFSAATPVSDYLTQIYAIIPEPATLSCLVLAAPLLLARRRA